MDLLQAAAHSCSCGCSSEPQIGQDGVAWLAPALHWSKALNALCAPDRKELQSKLTSCNRQPVEKGQSSDVSTLDFGVACLRVFWQANVTGPPPDVPEDPLQGDGASYSHTKVCCTILLGI